MSRPPTEQLRLDLPTTPDGRPYCKSCRTTRANLCRHDADLRHEAIDRTHKRPGDCLNHPQNRDGVPY